MFFSQPETHRYYPRKTQPHVVIGDLFKLRMKFMKNYYLCALTLLLTLHTHTHTQTHTCLAVVAQMVEHQLPKLRVVGSIPIYRSQLFSQFLPKSPLKLIKISLNGLFSSPYLKFI